MNMERLRALLEPVARAVRRGDSKRLNDVASRVHEVSTAPDVGDDGFEAGFAAGFATALRGIVDLAIDRVAADARQTLLSTRTHAMPALAALAAKAEREAKVNESSLQIHVASGGAIPIGELADAVNVARQNIRDTVDALVEHGLVREVRRGRSCVLSITHEGFEALGMANPNWRVTSVAAPPDKSSKHPVKQSLVFGAHDVGHAAGGTYVYEVVLKSSPSGGEPYSASAKKQHQESGADLASSRDRFKAFFHYPKLSREVRLRNRANWSEQISEKEDSNG